MPTAENGILYYEAGQSLVSMAALTDSGDHTTFESTDNFWSNRDGYEPDVRPNGIITGGVISPATSGTSDYVDVAALTCYLAGVETDVAADTDVDCDRPDATYFILSFASAAYTNCVAGDIGKTVVGGVTGDSGTLVAYNNTTRQWLIDEDAETDDFDDDDEGITITDGTGAGTLNAVGARPTHQINSVTVNSGGTIAVVQGTEGTSFSTTRGEIGGPPWIPTTSIEIGQVRYTSATAAAVDDDEIFQVIGTHQERYDYPTWDENRIQVADQVLDYAGVTFVDDLPLIHSDDSGTTTATKKVYAEYYEPVWAEIQNAENFVPPEDSYSVSSRQVYGGTVGASSASLGQGSFTFYANDGVTDNLIKLKGELLWFKFYPNRLKDPYVAAQGKLGVSRTYPAGDNIACACTISAEEASSDIAS